MSLSTRLSLFWDPFNWLAFSQFYFHAPLHSWWFLSEASTVNRTSLDTFVLLSIFMSFIMRKQLSQSDLAPKVWNGSRAGFCAGLLLLPSRRDVLLLLEGSMGYRFPFQTLFPLAFLGGLSMVVDSSPLPVNSGHLGSPGPPTPSSQPRETTRSWEVPLWTFSRWQGGTISFISYL